MDTASKDTQVHHRVSCRIHRTHSFRRCEKSLTAKNEDKTEYEESIDDGLGAIICCGARMLYLGLHCPSASVGPWCVPFAAAAAAGLRFATTLRPPSTLSSCSPFASTVEQNHQSLYRYLQLPTPLTLRQSLVLSDGGVLVISIVYVA